MLLRSSLFLSVFLGIISPAIAALNIPHVASSISPTIAISLGIANIIPREELSSDWLICQADQTPYQAKIQGRDRVSIEY